MIGFVEFATCLMFGVCAFLFGTLYLVLFVVFVCETCVSVCGCKCRTLDFGLSCVYFCFVGLVTTLGFAVFVACRGVLPGFCICMFCVLWVFDDD